MEVAEEDSPQITWNLGKMLHIALGRKGWIRCIENLTGSQAQPLLEEAIAWMEMFPAGHKRFNPQNGSGTYDMALEFLKELLAMSKKYPDGIFYVH